MSFFWVKHSIKNHPNPNTHTKYKGIFIRPLTEVLVVYVKLWRQKTLSAKANRSAQKLEGKHIYSSSQPILGPLAAILDFSDTVAVRRCSWWVSAPGVLWGNLQFHDFDTILSLKITIVFIPALLPFIFSDPQYFQDWLRLSSVLGCLRWVCLSLRIDRNWRHFHWVYHEHLEL